MQATSSTMKFLPPLTPKSASWRTPAGRLQQGGAALGPHPSPSPRAIQFLQGTVQRREVFKPKAEVEIVGRVVIDQMVEAGQVERGGEAGVAQHLFEGQQHDSPQFVGVVEGGCSRWIAHRSA